MSKFTPSEHQLKIFDFIQNGRGNAVISAVAGSGKTTTILQGLNLVHKSKSVLFVAFNKSIVNELTHRLEPILKKNPNIEVMTMHSFGNKALWYNYKSRVNNDKAYWKIREMIKGWNVDKDAVQGYIPRVKKLVELARLNLIETPKQLYALADKHGIEVYDSEVDNALDAKNELDQMTSQIDFTDMVYMPVKKNLKTKQYDMVFVDECQDLNPAQQALVRKAVRPGGRMIAVGDPFQAIYGFAGADVNSFNKLKDQPNTIELPLSVTYRCPIQVTKLAQAYVPHIQWKEGAKDGIVNNQGLVKDIHEGDMVLCRNFRPLVALCLKLLGEDKKAIIRGRDIGANLIKMITDTRAKTHKVLIKKLWVGHEKLINKMVARGVPKKVAEDSGTAVLYREKIGAIEILAGSMKTVDSIVKKIEDIFSDDREGIILSTVHKAKGLEANNVHICMPELMPSKYAKQAWQLQQECNLMYVAYTRAMKKLSFITDFKIK